MQHDVHEIHANLERSAGARKVEASSSWESAFRELLELAPEPVMLSDPEHGITDVNTAACRLYGYDRDELLRMTWYDLVEPEEAARFVRELPLVPGMVHVGEWQLKRKDASFVLIEASTKVLPDGRTLSFFRDISERKRAEREREESLSWLRAVLEQCPVALGLFRGRQGEQIEVNARAHDWLDAKPFELEALRRKVRTTNGDPITPEQYPSLRALRGERVAGAELLVPKVSGSMSRFSCNAAPVMGADGRVLGAVVAFEDITAEKELERLRAEWSSVVAHDLRHPLASISLNAQLAARAAEEPLRVAKHAERIRAAADRLNRMVGDLLDLSRLEASRLELVRQRVDLSTLLGAAVEQASLRAPDRPFEVRAGREVPPVYADPDRVTQVMENLLSNAVKYGTAGTAVVIDFAGEGAEVSVAVSNEGRPLAPDELAHIFERYQRTESAKLQGIQGVGLGLYITRSLVEAHGGRITAESTREGVTTLRFTLPVIGP